MDLKTVFSGLSQKISPPKETPNEVHLAIKISSTSVISTTWSVEKGIVSVGNVGVSKLEENLSWEEFVKSVDATISKSTQGQDDIHKTIFAIPLHWQKEGKIEEEHLKTIKRICKELDLFPEGYVVVNEALENFLKETEGAPLTGILIGIDGENSILSMYRAGKNLGTVPVSLNISEKKFFASSVETALKRFSDLEVFPSRFILFDGTSDLEAVSQVLTDYPWPRNLPFLHIPKVEILDAVMVVKAVAVAAGMQMGGSTENLNPNDFISSPKDPSTIEAVDDEGLPIELEEVSAEEAGFTTGDNLNELAIPFPIEKEQLPKERDVLKIQNKKINFSFLSFIKRIKIPTFSMFRIPKLKRPQFGLSPFLLLPIFVAITLVVIFVSYLVFAKTTIIVTVNSQQFNKQLDVVVAAIKEASPGAKFIPGTIIETVEIGTKKGVATGSKLVGEKAKGMVTLYSVSSSRSFAAGTVIVSPNGLRFTLDKDASIASGDAVSPATVSVGVTASDIGDKYNVSGGTKFSIGTFSSSQYLAQSSSAFSGGSSHQATVVTKTDQERLLNALVAELLQKSKATLKNQTTEGETLLDNAITSEIVKKTFSKEIDAEADTVSLDLSVKFKGIVFEKENMLALFKNIFASEIPSNFNLKEDALIEVLSSSNTQSNPILKTKISGKLVPVLNLSELKEILKGKPDGKVKEILSNLNGFSSYMKETNPKIFSSFSSIMLPLNKENLNLEIIAN